MIRQPLRCMPAACSGMHAPSRPSFRSAAAVASADRLATTRWLKEACQQGRALLLKLRAHGFEGGRLEVRRVDHRGEPALLRRQERAPRRRRLFDGLCGHVRRPAPSSWASEAAESAPSGGFAAWNQPEIERRGAFEPTSWTEWYETPGWTVKRTIVPNSGAIACTGDGSTSPLIASSAYSSSAPPSCCRHRLPGRER